LSRLRQNALAANRNFGYIPFSSRARGAAFAVAEENDDFAGNSGRVEEGKPTVPFLRENANAQRFYFSTRRRF
jgi:hypothetical protein